MNQSDPTTISEREDLERKIALLQAANKKLETLTTIDSLTNLPNHKGMIACVNHELERSQRFGRSFGALMIDLDDFRSLNYKYGHPICDKTLADFKQTVHDCLRGIDAIGRWKDDQFLVILPEMNRENALLTAESIRATLESNPLLGGVEDVYITCSIGAAMFPEDGLTRSELLWKADNAMRAAKCLGRDQVRSADDPTILTVTMEAETNETKNIQGEVEALAMLVSERDCYTGEHTNAVSDMAEEIALAMGMTEEEAHVVGLVGQLHDIGKITIPDAVLQKPAPLDDEEWKLMRRHPVVGADVVNSMATLRMIGPAIRAHHERWDGAGYPDGLAGDAIPMAARIVAVADAFGAMTSDRPYRKAQAIDWALEELHKNAGTQFDPNVVNAAEQIVRDLMSEQQKAA